MIKLGPQYLAGGYGTFEQLHWFSKKQVATAQSTKEAEMVALSKMLREVLVPQIGLWKSLLRRVVMGTIHEDSESTITAAVDTHHYCAT